MYGIGDAIVRDDSRTNQQVIYHLKAENGRDQYLSSLQETDYSTPQPNATGCIIKNIEGIFMWDVLPCTQTQNR